MFELSRVELGKKKFSYLFTENVNKHRNFHFTASYLPIFDWITNITIRYLVLNTHWSNMIAMLQWVAEVPDTMLTRCYTGLFGSNWLDLTHRARHLSSSWVESMHCRVELSQAKFEPEHLYLLDSSWVKLAPGLEPSLNFPL